MLFDRNPFHFEFPVAQANEHQRILRMPTLFAAVVPVVPLVDHIVYDF
jgi:hypothetical protein